MKHVDRDLGDSLKTKKYFWIFNFVTNRLDFSSFQKKILFLILLVLTLLTNIGCTMKENDTEKYLKNIELQYETEEQKQEIIKALNHVLSLDEKELQKQRYKDYQGKANSWDLSTLMYKYMVPNSSGSVIGANFYKDLKSDKAQKMILEILKKLESQEM